MDDHTTGREQEPILPPPDPEIIDTMQEGGDPAVLDDPSGPAEDPAPTQPEPAPEGAGADKPFLAGKWKGHEIYKCPECSYSVARPDGPSVIYAHLGQVHHVVELSKVLAPDGRPIVKVRKSR